MKKILLAVLAVTLLGAAATPEYSIDAIRYANGHRISVDKMVMGGPSDEYIVPVFVIWLVRGGGRNILFDSGFPRALVQEFFGQRLSATRQGRAPCWR
jgi:hypothetical protein